MFLLLHIPSKYTSQLLFQKTICLKSFAKRKCEQNIFQIVKCEVIVILHFTYDFRLTPMMVMLLEVYLKDLFKADFVILKRFQR